MHETTTFVIQLHLAKKAGRHWDFRIKRKGVLESWAVPKAKFPLKGERILAVRTPQHPLYWEKFKGKIDAGYGKGMVYIHDTGVCNIIQWKPDKIGFELQGHKEKGTFWLIRIHGSNKNTWIMLRSK